MTEKIQISGLCINCLYVKECKHRINHTNPIIFCEEFSCIAPTKSISSISKSISKVETTLHSSLKGLCINCENIEICNLQKPNEIVINCEEYR